MVPNLSESVKLIKLGILQKRYPQKNSFFHTFCLKEQFFQKIHKTAILTTHSKQINYFHDHNIVTCTATALKSSNHNFIFTCNVQLTFYYFLR